MWPLRALPLNRIASRALCRAVIGSMLTLGLVSAQAQSITVWDDAGRELTFEQPAQRIVSLAPAITENLFTVGVGNRIVGTSSFSNYPQAALSIPVVSDYQSIQLETIAKLKPDVVIAWQGGQSAAQLAALEQLHIPIYYQKINTLSDIPLSLMRLARLTATEASAAASITASYAQIRLLQDAPQPILTAFYQVWGQPLMTLNGESWISDALARCGARNIFAALPISAPTVGIENVLRLKPELIISASDTGQSDHSLDMWLPWQDLPAIKHHALLYTHADSMNRASVRTLAASEQLCQDIARVRTSQP